MMKACLFLALLVSAVVADIPPPGTNCHRSCYKMDLSKALPIKMSLFKTCNANTKVTIQKTMRGNPMSGDRSVKNAYSCGSVIQYKFRSWAALAAYQECEHSQATYIAKLQDSKKSLPPGVLRDFKC